MKKIHAFFLFFVLSLTYAPDLFGQRKIKRSKGLRLSFFDVKLDSLNDASIKDGFVYGGANFANQVIYLGRDNGVKQWAINPILGFQKNNWDVYFNGFFWSATTPKWAETDFGISRFWKLSEQIGIITTYEHAFIHNGTEENRYGLNNLASLQFSWTNRFFDLDTKYEYDWGRQNLTTLELSIGHELVVYSSASNGKIDITPRFYTTFIGGNTYPIRFFRPNIAFFPSGSEDFQIVNYEIELPLMWRKIGKMEWGISFNYAIPKNVLAEEGSGKPVFYGSVSFIKIIPLKGNLNKI
jgi:hypothetical protein